LIITTSDNSIQACYCQPCPKKSSLADKFQIVAYHLQPIFFAERYLVYSLTDAQPGGLKGTEETDSKVKLIMKSPVFDFLYKPVGILRVLKEDVSDDGICGIV
jgi:hypothetical protein